MKVIVKTKFNSTKESFESFGNSRYLVHLPFEQDDSSVQIIAELLSKHLCVPMGNIEFVAVDSNKNWIFLLS